jgi:uncharacterized tellurite resistance protein B-like protein
MLGRIARLLSGGAVAEPQQEHKRVQVATCCLLLEVAHADKQLHDLEEQTIRDLLAHKFDLDDELIAELIDYARGELDESLDLYQFAREINANFSIDEKYEVMEAIWRIIYADGVLDRYEDALARQISTLLRLDQRKSIDLKVKILDEQR